MTYDSLKELIEDGREIEFDFDNKRYSITYYPASENNTDISFCEFDHEPIDYKNAEELYNGTYNDISIKNIIDSLDEKEIDIF